MEEDIITPSEINGFEFFDVNKVLQANIIYLNKKRKFQAEQSALPSPKHKCWDRNLNSDFEPSANANLILKDYKIHTIKGKTVTGATDSESELESAEDSNSFDGDMDRSTSESDVKMILEHSQTTSANTPSTSVNCSNRSVNANIYSLESRSKAQNIGRDHNHPHNNFGLDTCLNFDEHLLEFGCHADFSSSGEHENDSVEQSKVKELEEIMYSNGMPSNYVLSSGRWSVKQETKEGSKKLTIDKEFEEYFSMLML